MNSYGMNSSVTTDTTASTECPKIINVLIDGIDWPEGHEDLPDEIRMSVCVREKDSNLLIGASICDALRKEYGVAPNAFDWVNTDDEDEDEDCIDFEDFYDDLIGAVEKETVKGRFHSVISVLSEYGVLPDEDEEDDEEDDEDCDGDCDNCDTPFDEDTEIGEILADSLEEYVGQFKTITLDGVEYTLIPKERITAAIDSIR